MVEEGYKLQFDPAPPPPRPSVPTSYSSTSSSIIRSLLLEYQQKGAITVVEIRPDQYVSRIFEVPKKTGDYRLILDLSDLNDFVKKVHFKMDGLHTITSLICRGDFLASLDLQDAFLSIAMHPSMYKYLCFDFDGVRYSFVALVFGLSCAPRIFTKLLKVPLAHLRLRGLKNSAWLDDIFLVGSDLPTASESVSQCRSFLESLGFLIKPSKSHLTPTQSIAHVGFIWDSVSFTVSVPPEKVSSFKELCMQATSGSVTLRFLAKLIGTAESFTFACPISPLHYRSLQFDLVGPVSSGAPWDSYVQLSSDAICDLDWWLSCDILLPPSSLASFSHTHTMETDASLEGWGSFSNFNLFT